MLLIVLYHFLEINANKTDGEGQNSLKGDRKELSSQGEENEALKGTRQATGAAGRGGIKGGVARG